MSGNTSQRRHVSPVVAGNVKSSPPPPPPPGQGAAAAVHAPAVNAVHTAGECSPARPPCHHVARAATAATAAAVPSSHVRGRGWAAADVSRGRRRRSLSNVAWRQRPTADVPARRRPVANVSRWWWWRRWTQPDVPPRWRPAVSHGGRLPGPAVTGPLPARLPGQGAHAK